MTPIAMRAATRARRTAALTIAALALAAAASPTAAVERLEKVEELEGALASGGRLVMSESSSSITVTPSSDGRVHVAAHKIAEGGSAAEREKVLGEITVRLEPNDEKRTLTVHTEIPDYARRRHYGFRISPLRWESATGAKAWVDFEVQIPAGAALDAEVTSGRVQVTDTEGVLQIATTSGDIAIARVRGDLDLSATSGAVSVADITGSMRLDVSSGDVSCERISGFAEIEFVSAAIHVDGVGSALSVSGTSGDVGLRGCPGPVEVVLASGDVTLAGGEKGLHAETSSGDVVAEVPAVGGSGIEIRTSSGDVTLDVRSAASANIDLSTASGTIRAKGPFDIDEMSRTSFQARVGEGGAQTIAIGTSSGDIALTAGASQ